MNLPQNFFSTKPNCRDLTFSALFRELEWERWSGSVCLQLQLHELAVKAVFLHRQFGVGA